MSLAVKKAKSCPSFEVSSKMGRWLNSCRPNEKFGELEIFTAFFMVFGMLFMLIPIFGNVPKETAALFASLGVLAILVGIGLLLFGIFAKKHIVHLYEGGLVREVSGKTLEFSWNEIKNVMTTESGFTPGVLSVDVFGNGKEKIVFNTKYQGDAREVINYLKANVADVEYRFLD